MRTYFCHIAYASTYDWFCDRRVVEREVQTFAEIYDHQRTDTVVSSVISLVFLDESPVNHNRFCAGASTAALVRLAVRMKCPD